MSIFGDINKSDSEIMTQFLDGLRIEIIKLQSDKGLRASGDSAASMNVATPNITTGQLIDALGYFYFQEFGRKRGGMPPVSKIYAWLEFKKYALQYSDDKERWSLSWAIAKKIRDKGTFTAISGRPTGVISEVLTRERIDGLVSVFAKKYAAEAMSDVIQSFRS